MKARAVCQITKCIYKTKTKTVSYCKKKNISSLYNSRYTFNFHIFRDKRVVTNQATLNLSCTQFRFSIQLVNLRNRTLTASTTTSTTSIPLAIQTRNSAKNNFALHYSRPQYPDVNTCTSVSYVECLNCSNCVFFLICDIYI